jgi:hypothetical protein
MLDERRGVLRRVRAQAMINGTFMVIGGCGFTMAGSVDLATAAGSGDHIAGGVFPIVAGLLFLVAGLRALLSCGARVQGDEVLISGYFYRRRVPLSDIASCEERVVAPFAWRAGYLIRRATEAKPIRVPLMQSGRGRMLATRLDESIRDLNRDLVQAAEQSDRAGRAT